MQVLPRHLDGPNKTACLLACLLAFMGASQARADSLRLALDAGLMHGAAETLSTATTGSTATTVPVAVEVGEHAAAAQPAAFHGIGLGVQIGTPTAVTLKFMVTPEQGLVVGVGAGFGFYRGFSAGLSLHADYLFTLAKLIDNGTLSLSAYVGPGVWLSIFNRGYGFGAGFYYSSFDFFGVAARLPLGLSLMFAALPIEVYLELDPALFVFPGIDFAIGASLGFRWYF